MKNGRNHEVPLSAQAVRLIEDLPSVGPYLFSFGDRPITNFKGKRRIDRLSGVTGWTLHDLRRTVASGMARLNIGLPVIEKVLNHQSGSFAGVVGVYQRHEFSEEKRRALDAWGNHVATITDESGKVVSLR